MATAVATVMAELGYEQYVLSAGDFGTDVAESLAAVHPDPRGGPASDRPVPSLCVRPARRSFAGRTGAPRPGAPVARRGGRVQPSAVDQTQHPRGWARRLTGRPDRLDRGEAVPVVGLRRRPGHGVHAYRGARLGSPRTGCTGQSGRRSRPTPIASRCPRRSPCRPRSPCFPPTSSVPHPNSRLATSTSGHGSKRPVEATSTHGNDPRTTPQASARRSLTAGSDHLRPVGVPAAGTARLRIWTS